MQFGDGYYKSDVLNLTLMRNPAAKINKSSCVFDVLNSCLEFTLQRNEMEKNTSVTLKRCEAYPHFNATSIVTNKIRAEV
jgi:hypothetical protein